MWSARSVLFFSSDIANALTPPPRPRRLSAARAPLFSSARVTGVTMGDHAAGVVQEAEDLGVQVVVDVVGADRSPHGSSCSCAYSRLPLQPRSSSAALKSPYIIRARSCDGCSHDAAPKYGVPRGISTSQGTTSWWAARGHSRAASDWAGFSMGRGGAAGGS